MSTTTPIWSKEPPSPATTVDLSGLIPVTVEVLGPMTDDVVDEIADALGIPTAVVEDRPG
jgi:hypothetical protein